MADVPGLPTHRKIIGQNILKQREAARLSQQQLAEKADIHTVYLSQIERGCRGASVDVLLRISRALGIRLREIFGDL